MRGGARHLVVMRSRYLRSGGRCGLNAELLSRLGLATTPCWTEEHLRRVQPRLAEALLCYWAPRFWMSPWKRTDGEGSAAASKAQRFPGNSVERMLQALHADSRAGRYFTHFCELSGNPLWENAAHFWSDLQRYHQLFYQDTLDPYTVQRQAQLLYSRFLSGSARDSVGAGEDRRQGVYQRLRPAFEELFDRVEEHVLHLLLEPWTLLVSRDTRSYQRNLEQNLEQNLETGPRRSADDHRCHHRDIKTRCHGDVERQRPSSGERQFDKALTACILAPEEIETAGYCSPTPTLLLAFNT
ncbi:unnamed protein product [Merluccius merluccius]